MRLFPPDAVAAVVDAAYTAALAAGLARVGSLSSIVRYAYRYLRGEIVRRPSDGSGTL